VLSIRLQRIFAKLQQEFEVYPLYRLENRKAKGAAKEIDYHFEFYYNDCLYHRGLPNRSNISKKSVKLSAKQVV